MKTMIISLMLTMLLGCTNTTYNSDVVYKPRVHNMLATTYVYEMNIRLDETVGDRLSATTVSNGGSATLAEGKLTKYQSFILLTEFADSFEQKLNNVLMRSCRKLLNASTDIHTIEITYEYFTPSLRTLTGNAICYRRATN